MNSLEMYLANLDVYLVEMTSLRMFLMKMALLELCLKNTSL